MELEAGITLFWLDRPGIRKVLGDLEAEIMELIWTRPSDQGTTVRGIFEILHERRQLAYTTVMSTMTRLAKKHLLRVEKQENAYVYYPTCTQQEFVARFVHRILEDLFVNFSPTTAAGGRSIQDARATMQAKGALDQITRWCVHEEQE
jgi:predicted transcriptional regulator